jgi:predicted aminopeptidase
VREFARDRLGLNVDGAYSSYAVVDSGALVHVLSAAETSRLVPYRWWFPIVGSVEYKGFFARDDAEREAKRLGARGYDTYIRPAGAFSTLGWFDDPVLSSWLAWRPVAIAETLIHELLHRTCYVHGQTTFNESLANFVGHRGAIAYFTERDGVEGASTLEAETDWRRELEAARRLAAAKLVLGEIYSGEASAAQAPDSLLARREEVFDDLGRELRAIYPSEAGSARRKPLEFNNAVLLALLGYMTELDRFDSVWTANGRDLRSTIGRIAAATKQTDDPFAVIAQLAGARADS